MDPSIGTLLVALDSGLVQVWSHHPRGGFIRAFHAIHIMRDCCMSLATDLNNEFLITGKTIVIKLNNELIILVFFFPGHVKGYIKVWLLKNYVVDGTVSKINMPALRLEFPFLWKDRIPGRTKRAVKDQSLPLLLSSFKGHSKPVNAVQFIPGARLIVRYFKTLINLINLFLMNFIIFFLKWKCRSYSETLDTWGTLYWDVWLIQKLDNIATRCSGY